MLETEALKDDTMDKSRSGLEVSVGTLVAVLRSRVEIDGGRGVREASSISTEETVQVFIEGTLSVL